MDRGDEFLLNIFSYLDVIDLIRSRLVCKKWNRIALDFTLPLCQSLRRDADLRDLLTSGIMPEDPLFPTCSKLNMYGLYPYLVKNGNKEIIGNRYGNIVEKVNIYATRYNLKDILQLKISDSYYYNVIRLSWILMRRTF